VTVKGFGGFTKHLDTAGDHPLLGEVLIDPENEYNIVSYDLLRECGGYLRSISEDNKKEYLYNKEINSVLTFERDPFDGFYKMSMKDLNKEMKRTFPKMCYSAS
jgi:hypothetical protein